VLDIVFHDRTDDHFGGVVLARDQSSGTVLSRRPGDAARHAIAPALLLSRGLLIKQVSYYLPHDCVLNDLVNKSFAEKLDESFDGYLGQKRHRR
jgi:hypothetical protein